MTRLSFRNTWTPVPGQTERPFRVRHAHPLWRDHLRLAAESVLFVLGIVVVIAVLSLVDVA